jgi:hypothetical protein
MSACHWLRVRGVPATAHTSRRRLPAVSTPQSRAVPSPPPVARMPSAPNATASTLFMPGSLTAVHAGRARQQRAILNRHRAMTDESPLLADDENGILCSARPATRCPSSRNRVEHRSGGDARLAEVEAGHALCKRRRAAYVRWLAIRRSPSRAVPGHTERRILARLQCRADPCGAGSAGRLGGLTGAPLPRPCLLRHRVRPLGRDLPGQPAQVAVAEYPPPTMVIVLVVVVTAALAAG